MAGSAEAIVDEYMFYIGSVLVKMPAAEPEMEAIKQNFRTPSCNWCLLEISSNTIPCRGVRATSSFRFIY